MNAISTVRQAVRPRAMAVVVDAHARAAGRPGRSTASPSATKPVQRTQRRAVRQRLGGCVGDAPRRLGRGGASHSCSSSRGSSASSSSGRAACRPSSRRPSPRRWSPSRSRTTSKSCRREALDLVQVARGQVPLKVASIRPSQSNARRDAVPGHARHRRACARARRGRAARPRRPSAAAGPPAEPGRSRAANAARRRRSRSGTPPPRTGSAPRRARERARGVPPGHVALGAVQRGTGGRRRACRRG